jgi:hypothetical protein
MAKKQDFPLLDVAAVIITRGKQVLAVYNPGWGGFTLPMTKRREWRDPKLSKSLRQEDWIDAAARAGAEWLGATCMPEFLFEDAGEFQQSERDGNWKRYHFQVFRIAMKNEQPLAPATITEWLTPTEWHNRRPVSPTARYLIGKLQEEKLLS